MHEEEEWNKQNSNFHEEEEEGWMEKPSLIKKKLKKIKAFMKKK